MVGTDICGLWLQVSFRSKHRLEVFNEGAYNDLSLLGVHGVAGRSEMTSSNSLLLLLYVIEMYKEEEVFMKQNKKTNRSAQCKVFVENSKVK